MVLEASDSLKQIWEGLRDLQRALKLFSESSQWHLEVFGTFKTVPEANLKQLWTLIRRYKQHELIEPSN